jgi:glutamine amidotransferase
MYLNFTLRIYSYQELLTSSYPSTVLTTEPTDSLHIQDPRRPHNGDGFGVGYYTTNPTLGPSPCLFTSTTPAWNCINLSRLATKTTSPLIFAHVRATTSGALSSTNCHPFRYEALMFMHNGNIALWPIVKRQLCLSISERWFLNVQGGTDSEWAFAIFLDCLEKMGVEPSADPGPKGFGHTVLRKAMLQTIARINALVRAVPKDKLDGEELETRSLLNFAVADGRSVVCTRYVSSRTDEAASLYWSSGTSWRDGGGGKFVMERRDKGADIVLVASEPLTFERGGSLFCCQFSCLRNFFSQWYLLTLPEDNWVTVPTNSTLTIHKQTVMIHPIEDEYSAPSPSYARATQFAKSMGLVSNAPGVTEVATPGLTDSDGETDGEEDGDEA